MDTRPMTHSETRAALQERPSPPRSLFTHLAEEHAATEIEIVKTSGYAVSVGLPDVRARRELDQLLDRLEASDPALYFDMETAVNDFEIETAERAYVIGYALARTWTGRIADLSDWPQRARAYANLTDDEQRQDAEAAPPCGEPFEGETIAGLVERSGSVGDGPYAWLELAVQTLWEESPQRAAYRDVDAAAVDLIERGAPVAVHVFGWFDDQHVHRTVAALDYAARVGYAFGRYAHLPEPERVARAKGLASLLPVPNIGGLPVTPSLEEEATSG